MIPKAFRDDAMSTAQIKVWHKCFKACQESVESDHVPEGLQQTEHLRMLNVYRLQSAEVSD